MKWRVEDIMEGLFQSDAQDLSAQHRQSVQMALKKGVHMDFHRKSAQNCRKKS